MLVHITTQFRVTIHQARRQGGTLGGLTPKKNQWPRTGPLDFDF
jgi:hypothetical protein